MNTNTLKSFAKSARLNLIKGVVARLNYWGFDHKGNCTEEIITASGGYSFRGEASDDTSVPEKWNKLKTKIQATKKGFEDVAEEAAYSWFNRLLAIKILEENEFITPTLQFVAGSHIPTILQNAKGGNHAITHSGQEKNLQEALLNNDDEKAFAILITSLCQKHPLLHQVFGSPNDYTEILIPQGLLSADGFLSALNDTENIAEEDYCEVELIGWLYQFYISDRKDAVFAQFKKNVKARAEDIPAATQIFTPKWIVNYMVQNTVGKIYLDYEEDDELKAAMNYLVENDTPSSALIDDITELTLIDPASGSGHILVTGFEWLYKMYRKQGYGAKQAVESILTHNLYGLEIDDRAMQLARFAVLLKASLKLKEVELTQALTFIQNPILPHIYAFPESVEFTSDEVAEFTKKQAVKEVYDALDTLRQGKNIGSALKITLAESTQEILKANYTEWTAKYQQGALDIQQSGIWTRIKPYIEIALTLTKRYTAVVANPPYMGQKSMNAELKNYVNKEYSMTKADLMTVFMEVIPNLTKDGFSFALINLPSWLFLSTFEKMREHYLVNYQIESLLHMGRGIFGIDFGSVAFTIRKQKVKDAKGSYFRLHERNFQHIYYEDIEKLFLNSNGKPSYKYDFKQYRDEDGVNDIPTTSMETGRKLFYPNIPQSNFEKIPGNPIAYWVGKEIIEIFINNQNASDFYIIKEGLKTGDNNHFIKNWYEVENRKISVFNGTKFFPHSKGGGFRKWYGNHIEVLNYEDNGKDLNAYKGASLTGKENYFKEYTTWSRITSNKASFRKTPKGFIPNMAGLSAISKGIINKEYILSYGNSKVGLLILNLLNPTLNFPPGVISKLPIIFPSDSIQKKIDDTANGSIDFSKSDWDSRETSWDFEQNPLLLQQTTSLSSSYQSWLAKVSADFFQLHQNEEELNRIFIEIYGLEEELTPEVALKDITILQDELKKNDLDALEEEFRSKGTVALPIQKDVVMSQLLSYLIGCMMGRYRLDKNGLHIAHPNPTEEELSAYNVENAALPFTFQIDEDAILPLMGSACAFPDDTLRQIEKLVHHIWGDESLNENFNFINASLGMTMEKWLTEKFWEWHISGTMYKKKPIYWLFTSNPKKPQNAAFRVLVYMHRMDGFTVQRIMNNYLHPHQEYVRSELEKLLKDEGNLTKQDIKRKELLEKQIIELREYNEVLKDIAGQQITFDLDDGVTENYKLFEGVVARV